MSMGTSIKNPNQHLKQLTPNNIRGTIAAMKISNSLEWDSVRRGLKLQIQQLPYDVSIRQLLKNIDRMVDELSKIEVEARRTKVSYYKDAQVSKVNEAIESLDKIIVVAILFT